MYDQLSTYSSTVRKTIRWYHKVATELLPGTTIVNANFMKNKLNRNQTLSKITIINIILIHDSDTDKLNKKIRRRCIHCYEKLRAMNETTQTANNKVVKVNTYCSEY
ncbi:hypothetical protein HHI36_006623 [Cryptolaemus montrouzieri]|uniref:Uncharacterized protein n=1 Tax=Cryptolaemus montrouzieri TaxID=559131 RepID=A0ABD2NXL5_9CUCU